MIAVFGRSGTAASAHAQLTLPVRASHAFAPLLLREATNWISTSGIA
ncbi:hypothetical protein [Arthrobacter sp. D2-10]